MGLPHLSHLMSVSRTGAAAPLPSGPRSRVALHFGYVSQDKNQPFLPHFLIILAPHSSQTMSVFSMGGFHEASFFDLSSCSRKRL